MRPMKQYPRCRLTKWVPPDPGDAAAARRRGTGRRGTAGDERGGVGWSRVEKLARQAGKTCERERMLKDEERGGRDGNEKEGVIKNKGC